MAALAALDSEFGRTTDPVRMYMREMGVVELLEQKDEVRIAKEIEAGVYQIMKAISLYPKITDYFFKAYTRLEEGKCKMTDVVIGYQGDAEEFEEKQALIVEKQALSLQRWNLTRLVKKRKKNLMSWNIRVQMKRKYINSLKKFKKALRPMLMLTRSMVILITKQSKLDRNSQSAMSELRLAPKLVSTMMEVVSHRVNDVKKEVNIIRQACLDAGMPRQLFYDSFPGNETNSDWLSSTDFDSTLQKALQAYKDDHLLRSKKPFRA